MEIPFSHGRKGMCLKIKKIKSPSYISMKPFHWEWGEWRKTKGEKCFFQAWSSRMKPCFWRKGLSKAKAFQAGRWEAVITEPFCKEETFPWKLPFLRAGSVWGQLGQRVVAPKLEGLESQFMWIEGAWWERYRGRDRYVPQSSVGWKGSCKYGGLELHLCRARCYLSSFLNALSLMQERCCWMKRERKEMWNGRLQVKLL